MSDTNKHTEWTPPAIALQALTDKALPLCIALAEQLNASREHSGEAIIITANESAPSHYWVLKLGDELPRLQRADGVHWAIDFCNSKIRRRATEPNRSHHPIAKALGISKLSAAERATWHVVDGTAGAGADGWQLAAAGATVTLVEQNPVLYTLLEAAIVAALDASDEPSRLIALRVSVLNQRVETMLSGEINPQVRSGLSRANSPSLKPVNAVYLDPMYPKRRSSAAVKKPMQFIQGLVGAGPDPIDVLQSCLLALADSSNALSRVVVKRPSEAAALISSQAWDGQLIDIDAGAARFDVYLKR